MFGPSTVLYRLYLKHCWLKRQRGLYAVRRPNLLRGDTVLITDLLIFFSKCTWVRFQVEGAKSVGTFRYFYICSFYHLSSVYWIYITSLLVIDICPWSEKERLFTNLKCVSFLYCTTVAERGKVGPVNRFTTSFGWLKFLRLASVRRFAICFIIKHFGGVFVLWLFLIRCRCRDFFHKNFVRYIPFFWCSNDRDEISFPESITKQNPSATKSMSLDFMSFILSTEQKWKHPISWKSI